MPRLSGILLALAASSCLAASPVLAQAPAYLVREIGSASPPQPPASSQPHDFLAAGNALLFLASTPTTGLAVWATDGTSVGTEMLHYPCLYQCAEDPQFLGHLGRVAFWQEVPLDPDRPLEIWRSDGTRAGTSVLLSGSAIPGVATPAGFLFFYCDTGCGFWRTDGTVAGTRSVLAFLPAASFPAALYPAILDPTKTSGSRMVLGYDSASNPGLELWVSDGTPAGSFRFATVPHRPLTFTAAGGHVFFVVAGSGGKGDQLWASDGTAAGTRQVSAFTTAHPFGVVATLLPVGDRVFFVPDDGGSSHELWTSDGTPAGTVRVSQLGSARTALASPGSVAVLGSGRFLFLAQDGTQLRLFRTDGTPASMTAIPTPPIFGGLTALPGRVLFPAGDAAHGNELWSTDGTTAGTVPLDVPCPGRCSSAPDDLQALGSIAFFNAADRAGQRALWSTDGTAAGTHEFASVAADGAIGQLGGRAFFAAQDSHGIELWTSDGKTGGTSLLADLAVAPPVATPRELTAAGDRLFFSPDDGGHTALWQSDGTAAGTVPSPVDCSPAFDLPPFVGAGGDLFFVCQGTDGLYRVERTDGTAAGTVLLPAPALAAEPLLGGLGGSALFLFGSELWKSDGTAAGTVKLADLPGFPDSAALLTTLGPEAYFEIGTENGQEVWRSDGTAAGTRRVLAAGCLSLRQTPLFTRVGSLVYFFTNDCEALDQLWVTDGTAAGTRAVTAFPPSSEGLTPRSAAGLDGRLYFTGFTPDLHYSLFQSDGTAAGTVLFHQFFGIDELTPFAGRLFFSAIGGPQGSELWSTDGTAAGTALVRDILPGPDPSVPAHLTVAGGRLYFTADDGVHGVELWQSDGTPAGTRLVQDIAPEGRSSSPDALTVAGDRLYFTADDGLAGRSLWALPLAGPAGCQSADTRLCLAGGRFQVEIAWQDFQGNTGAGHAVSLTADTGSFWFFAPGNTEVIVKVLDARALNQAFWVFYGALSNVEYTMTVTDTATGLTRRYQNPAGHLASVGDTAGFGPLGAFDTRSTAAPAAAPAVVSARTEAAAATGSCAPGPERLCLQNGRFAVQAAWKDFQGRTGTGTAVPLQGDTGYFWFFAPENVEVVTKILDGRGLNGKFWFFYGALSNVEYTLTVTDTAAGSVKTYKNPSGTFGSLADTAAF